MKVSLLIVLLFGAFTSNSQVTIEGLQGTWKQNHFSYRPCFDGKGIKDYNFYDSTGNVGILKIEFRHDTAYLTTPTKNSHLLLVTFKTIKSEEYLRLSYPKKFLRKQEQMLIKPDFEGEKLVLTDLAFHRCRQQDYFAEQMIYYLDKVD